MSQPVESIQICLPQAFENWKEKENSWSLTKMLTDSNIFHNYVSVHHKEGKLQNEIKRTFTNL